MIQPKTIDFKLYENLRHRYNLLLVELEQAKTDRNKAAMLERRKYLSKLSALSVEIKRLSELK